MSRKSVHTCGRVHFPFLGTKSNHFTKPQLSAKPLTNQDLSPSSFHQVVSDAISNLSSEIIKLLLLKLDSFYIFHQTGSPIYMKIGNSECDDKALPAKSFKIQTCHLMF